MQKLQHPVKASLEKGGKTMLVGMAEFYKFDTLAEAAATISEKDALDALNRQVRTDALNVVRQEATKPISVEQLRAKAMMNILKAPNVNEIVAGGDSALEAAIANEIERLKNEDAAARKARIEAAQAANPAEAADATGSEENAEA